MDSSVQRWLAVHRGLPVEVETVVAGHTRISSMRLVDRRLVLNPGSVGLRYGRAGAHRALLDRGLVSFG